VPIRGMIPVVGIGLSFPQEGRAGALMGTEKPDRVRVKKMAEVFDYGTGVPYTYEDLEALFKGEVIAIRKGPNCSKCSWFDAASCELCRGPATCMKWANCGKCCALTGRTSLIDFETCPQFVVDPIMCQ
jgi:hypothetical protein